MCMPLGVQIPLLRIYTKEIITDLEKRLNTKTTYLNSVNSLS